MVNDLRGGSTEEPVQPPVPVRPDDDEVGPDTARGLAEGLPGNTDIHVDLLKKLRRDIRRTPVEIRLRSAFEHIEKRLLGGLPEVLRYVGGQANRPKQHELGPVCPSYHHGRRQHARRVWRSIQADQDAMQGRTPFVRQGSPSILRACRRLPGRERSIIAVFELAAQGHARSGSRSSLQKIRDIGVRSQAEALPKSKRADPRARDLRRDARPASAPSRRSSHMLAGWFRWDGRGAR